MKKTVLVTAICLLLSITVYGGEISGTVYYYGSESLPVTVAILEGMGMDFTSAPHTMIMEPGPYTIEGDFSSYTPYTPIAVMITGLGPESGDPIGKYPYPLIGSAEDINIVLKSKGDIGGTITYPGPAENLTINIYDTYESDTDSPELTEKIGSYDYVIHWVPAGPKKVQVFDDLNKNGTLDDGEPSSYYSGLTGEIVLVGGGSTASTSTNITLSRSDITENPNETGKERVKVYPNPSQKKINIKLNNFVDLDPSQVDISLYSLSGKKILTNPISVLSVQGEDNYQLDVSSISGGCYLLKIEKNLFSHTEKIVVME